MTNAMNNNFFNPFKKEDVSNVVCPHGLIDNKQLKAIVNPNNDQA